MRVLFLYDEHIYCGWHSWTGRLIHGTIRGSGDDVCWQTAVDRNQQNNTVLLLRSLWLPLPLPLCPLPVMSLMKNSPLARPEASVNKWQYLTRSVPHRNTLHSLFFILQSFTHWPHTVPKPVIRTSANTTKCLIPNCTFNINIILYHDQIAESKPFET